MPWCRAFLVVISVALTLSCSQPVRQGQAGIESTEQGIRIIANYDSRFDNLLDNYQLLTVTFLNQSPNVVELSHKRDIWTLTTKTGEEIKAINHLRQVDGKAWDALPLKAQELIEYPQMVIRNTTLTFDIIFPRGVDLTDFKRIDIYVASLEKTFRGGSTYEQD